MGISSEQLRKGLSKTWRVVLWCLVFSWVIFVIPKIEKILRPDMVTKIERMLKTTALESCSMNIERDDEVSILITTTAAEGIAITTEISKYSLKKIHKNGQEIVFRAHTINQHPNGSFYLTQTQIWADAELTRARRIEVEYCDLMKDPDGRVTYEGHVPVYECAVPIERASCLAKDTENHAQ